MRFQLKGCGFKSPSEVCSFIVKIVCSQVWVKNVASHISKQRTSCSSSHQPLRPSQQCSLRGIQDGKKQDTGRLQPTRLLHPWNSPGKSTGVGCHCLFQLELARPKIGEGNGNPLQYSCLGNSTDSGSVGYIPWDRKELATTVWLTFTFRPKMGKNLTSPRPWVSFVYSL